MDSFEKQVNGRLIKLQRINALNSDLNRWKLTIKKISSGFQLDLQEVLLSDDDAKIFFQKKLIQLKDFTLKLNEMTLQCNQCPQSNKKTMPGVLIDVEDRKICFFHANFEIYENGEYKTNQELVKQLKKSKYNVVWLDLIIDKKIGLQRCFCKAKVSEIPQITLENQLQFDINEFQDTPLTLQQVNDHAFLLRKGHTLQATKIKQRQKLTELLENIDQKELINHMVFKMGDNPSIKKLQVGQLKKYLSKGIL